MITGFIGPGMMGQPIAGHLLAAGHDLAVHSRTRAKAEPLLAGGAHWATTPAEVAAAADVVLTMVGGPDDVAAVYRGAAGLLAAAREGQILVDLTTPSPELAAALAAAAPPGVICLDAPVTGGVRGATAGTLTLMVGGNGAALDSIRPILGALPARSATSGRQAWASTPSSSIRPQPPASCWAWPRRSPVPRASGSMAL